MISMRYGKPWGTIGSQPAMIPPPAYITRRGESCAISGKSLRGQAPGAPLAVLLLKWRYGDYCDSRHQLY
jgi:hypothetical protein